MASLRHCPNPIGYVWSQNCPSLASAHDSEHTILVGPIPSTIFPCHPDWICIHPPSSSCHHSLGMAQAMSTHDRHGCSRQEDKEYGLGIIYPSVEYIAQAIAKRDKAKIVPMGAYALNRLGLSTQMPMNVVLLTNGAPRRIRCVETSSTHEPPQRYTYI